MTVLSGHTQCLDIWKRHDAGHGGSFTNCVVCGGSGYSLRDQRGQGPDLIELPGVAEPHLITVSHLYVGRSWADSHCSEACSALRRQSAANSTDAAELPA